MTSSRAMPVAQRLLRVHPWGQLALLPAAGETAAQLQWELLCPVDRQPAALALADLWRRQDQPTVLPVLDARLAGGAAGQRPALQLIRPIPRGPRLTEVLRRAEALTQAQVAVLVADLLATAVALHGQGLAIGEWSPAELVLCPPGAEDQPCLVAVQAGLASWLQVCGQLQDSDEQNSPWHTPGMVAPEVLAGQPLSAASDTYSACALIVWLLLRRHVHSAANLTQLRLAAEAGPGRLAVPLQDRAPQWATLLLQGLSPSPWQRAGVLPQLLAALQPEVEGRPTWRIDQREVLAAWGMGSPLMPLAAYAQGGSWLDQPLSDVVSQPSSVPSGMTAVAAPAHLPAPERAKLQAALDRLDMERLRGQRLSEEQGERWQSRLVVATVVLFVLVGILLVGLRQTRELDPTAIEPGQGGAVARPPAPPRPQPIDLTPESPE